VTGLNRTFCKSLVLLNKHDFQNYFLYKSSLRTVIKGVKKGPKLQLSITLRQLSESGLQILSFRTEIGFKIGINEYK